MKKRVLFITICIWTAILTSSCLTDIKYSEGHPFNDATWSYTDTVTFKIENEQNTFGTSDVILFVRNRNTYHYRNLHLNIALVSPSGTAMTSAHQLQLADEHGLWKGTGWTTLFTTEYVIRKDFDFSDKGTYKIVVTHQMRDDLLLGIEDIGIYLKKPNENHSIH